MLGFELRFLGRRTYTLVSRDLSYVSINTKNQNGTMLLTTLKAYNTRTMFATYYFLPFVRTLAKLG
jgi:uncharacterized protein HemY